MTVQVLTVPNWSFGRDSDLLERFGGVLDHYGVEVHYLLGDVDHNRTVSAFSGHHEIVARVDRLRLPSYTGFVMPKLEPIYDSNGGIANIEISYPCDLTEQMLEFSAERRASIGR